MDPPSGETLPSPADTATQSASHDEALSTEAQSTESLSVTEETAPILPVPLESRNSPPAPKEPPVVDQGEPSSQHVSFSMIMKLPSLTEKKKSKRSEESEIVTSSPYKQSFVEKKTEQNKKSKQKLVKESYGKLRCNNQSARKLRWRTRNQRKPRMLALTLWKTHNVQCVMDFGRTHWQERIGSSVPSAKTGCTKSAVAL